MWYKTGQWDYECLFRLQARESLWVFKSEECRSEGKKTSLQRGAGLHVGLAIQRVSITFFE